MDQTVRLRDSQLTLGWAYLVVAAGALLRHPDPLGLAACGAVSIFSYLTGRTLPPVEIPARDLWRAVGVGVVVVSAVATVVALGLPSWMPWAQVAMSYCSANRFRAGGLFQSADV
jgi:hypothetical protein